MKRQAADWGEGECRQTTYEIKILNMANRKVHPPAEGQGIARGRSPWMVPAGIYTREASGLDWAKESSPESVGSGCL